MNRGRFLLRISVASVETVSFFRLASCQSRSWTSSGSPIFRPLAPHNGLGARPQLARGPHASRRNSAKPERTVAGIALRQRRRSRVSDHTPQLEGLGNSVKLQTSARVLATYSSLLTYPIGVHDHDCPLTHFPAIRWMVRIFLCRITGAKNPMLENVVGWP